MIPYNKLESAWDSYSSRLKPLWKNGEIDQIYSRLRMTGTEGKQVTPAPSQTWRALVETPLNILRGVIVGDYPYNYKISDKLVADGLCLGASNHAGEGYVPEELKRWNHAIEKEMCEGLCLNAITDGYVPYFLSKEGILMWNLSLTTVVGDTSDPHAKIWQPFQSYFFDQIISPARVPVITLGRPVYGFVKQYIHQELIYSLKHPRESNFTMDGQLKEVGKLIKETTGYEVDFTISLPF